MSDTGNKARRLIERRKWSYSSGCEDATYKGEERVGPLAAAEVHHLDFRVVQEFMAAALIAIPAEFQHIGSV